MLLWIKLQKQLHSIISPELNQQIQCRVYRLPCYPHATDISDISQLTREHINTPRESLLRKHFNNDHWGLIKTLRVTDRTLNKRLLNIL